MADITVKKEEDITVAAGDGIVADELDTIINYTNYKAVSLANEIKDGNVSVNSEDEKSCSYCEYKDICHRDEIVSKVNKSEKIDSKNVLDKMKQSLNPKKDEDSANEDLNDSSNGGSEE